MDIRLLKANEIECRIGTVKEGKGISLLLYKDARVDQKILDEVYGPTNWKREHKVMGTPIVVTELDKYKNSKEVVKGQYFSCIVSVWDSEKKEWISKEDTGNESNTDEIKGLYSDSFKRACVNFGIGRELYTSPFIWIPASKGYTKYEKFEVKDIGYNEEREINYLVIVDSKGVECFRFGKSTSLKTQKIKEELINEDERKELFLIAKGLKTDIVKEILHSYGFENSNEITKKEFRNICETIEKSKKMYSDNVGA